MIKPLNRACYIGNNRQKTNNLDKNETPFNIFIDLSKAFDTINHYILLNKLKYYGVTLTGTSLELITDYLSMRLQYTQINDVTSSLLLIKTGLPQGSMLVPLMFKIYTNDIINATKKLNIISFADDTTWTSTIEKFSKISQKEAIIEINKEINDVITWLEVNKVSINIEKTKATIFYLPPKILNEVNFKIQNIEISNIDNYNYLGIIKTLNCVESFFYKLASN